MLYQLHEMNRTLLAPLMQWAEATATLYSSPASPLAALPYAQRVAAGYELLYRLGKDYEKPNFELNDTTDRRQKSRHRRTDRARKTVLPPDPLQEGFGGQAIERAQAAQGAAGGAVVRPSCHPAARYRARPAAGTRRLHHRLDRCPHGAGRSRPVPSARLCLLRPRFHPCAGTGRASDLGMPTDRAGTGRGGADGHGQGQNCQKA